MPNRMIKESICTSEQIDALTPFEETTFYRLMVNADDYGCFDGREKVLAARLYPLKTINPADMRAAVDRLEAVGLIARYTVEGREYLHFPTWFNHQRLRQTKHKFPPPVDAISGSLPHDAETCGKLPQIAADFGKMPPVAALARASTSTSTSSSSSSVSSSDSVFDEEQNASDGDHWFNTETKSGSTMKDGEWMPDEDARKLQREQDEVLTAAENAGFDRTNLVRGKLLSLFAEHGREKMLFAIEESATHGAANLAYLSAVLSGKGGKKKGGYEQRDYTAEQDAAVARMMADSWGDE